MRERRFGEPIRVDKGSEFIARDLDLWAYANHVPLDFLRPGKPTDYGCINSKFRAECLNAHWFMALADTREKLEETWSSGHQLYNLPNFLTLETKTENGFPHSLLKVAVGSTR